MLFPKNNFQIKKEKCVDCINMFIELGLQKPEFYEPCYINLSRISNLDNYQIISKIPYTRHFTVRINEEVILICNSNSLEALKELKIILKAIGYERSS